MTIGTLVLPTTTQHTTTPQSVLKNYHASDKSRSPIILGEGKAKTSVLSDYYVTNRSAVPVSLTPSPSLYLSNYKENTSISLIESDKHALTGYSITKQSPVTLSSCPTQTVEIIQKDTSSGILGSFHITGKDKEVKIEQPNNDITLASSSSLYLGGYSIPTDNKITLNKSTEPVCIQPTLTNYTTQGNVTLSKSEKKETYYWDGIITGNVIIKSIVCNDKKIYTIDGKSIYKIGVDSKTKLIIGPKVFITTLINADAEIDLKSPNGFKVVNVFTINDGGGMILDISFNGGDRLTLKVSTTTHSQPIGTWKETPKNHLGSYSATNQDSISLSESTVNNAKKDPLNDYTYNHMKLPSILEEVTRDHRKHCKSKFGDLYDNNDYESILKGIIKKQKGICCDDIDLSKHVLKSSIVPCANLIPDKYKKYAEKYKPGEDGPEEEQIDIHKENVEDKFSISFIASMILIIVIILMKLL